MFDGFLETYPEYNDDEGRFAEYGEFCLTNNDPDLALIVLNQGVHRLPNSAAIHNMLGDAYRMKQDIAQATNYYKNAIKLADKNQESKLAKYEANLNSLKK